MRLWNQLLHVHSCESKVQTCWLEHVEFDTNPSSSPSTRLCPGQWLRPLSIKGTIHRVPTARSPQLPLVYDLRGLSRNSCAEEKIFLFSLMDNFHEEKCLFWLQLSAHNLEQDKNFVIQYTSTSQIIKMLRKHLFSKLLLKREKVLTIF